MNIGQRIKERRKEIGLSVDDVALKLNKNRATVYRYESNDIENLPINILEPLAKILETTPSYLMGWDVEENTNITVSKDELELLNNYMKLNSLGKKEANKRISELSEINKYVKFDNSKNKLLTYDDFDTIAAHNDNLTDNEILEADRRILEDLNKRR